MSTYSSAPAPATLTAPNAPLAAPPAAPARTASPTPASFIPAPTLPLSPELAQYTSLLNQANLGVVTARITSLRRLQQFTNPDRGTPVEQLRTCGTIKALPFLRMSKKVRTNPLNAEFVAAGRAANRELLAAKISATNRLSELALDPAIAPEIQCLAAAVNVRSSSGMKVDWGELNDHEIPEHLLPPKQDESDFLSTPYPVAQHIATHANPIPAPTTTLPRPGKPFGLPGNKRSPFKKRK